MQYRILTVLCILLLFSGCKTKAPEQKTESSNIIFSSSQDVSSKTPPASDQNKLNCTLSISCNEILKNKDKFSEDKLSSVPLNGIIHSNQTIEFKSGDTVFDLLLRETKANDINLDYVSSAFYKTNYIKGIAGIYEKDFGSTSGWVYTVNDNHPLVSCNSYKLKNSDKVKWIFICEK